MPVVQCVECGQDMRANDEDVEGYCPDCYGEQDTLSHGTHYQREQARSLEADEHRQRVVDNDAV